MTEDDLRALVRAAVARHLGGAPEPAAAQRPAVLRGHASHRLFVLPADAHDADGLCRIEPAVVCTHCGYCQSYGH